ncbi:hypothetical protein INT45_012556 [Circinella minor]|uniref:BZIP domain-containing protein n=1 Tax=Circinella minor TaxID=1195481 RepID=A0A8H7S2R8_9FUNG|nr:hypothetical protein INT45_012556 [Circinella minor]
MSLTADFDPKPMAISSIISSTSSSFSTTSSNGAISPPSYQAESSSSSAPSSPESRQQQDIYHHHHRNHQHEYHHDGSNIANTSLYNTPVPSCGSGRSTTPPPLSLQERRQRNKAASAKYRAKKNQQHGEMRLLIASLTKENELLLRQLDHIKRENSRLKATCDRLRGKKVAANILKRFLASGNNGNSKSSNNVTTDEALEQFDMDEDEEEYELDDLMMDPQQPPQH